MADETQKYIGNLVIPRHVDPLMETSRMTASEDKSHANSEATSAVSPVLRSQYRGVDMDN
jgi:hypothetical protein